MMYRNCAHVRFVVAVDRWSNWIWTDAGTNASVLSQPSKSTAGYWGPGQPEYAANCEPHAPNLHTHTHTHTAHRTRTRPFTQWSPYCTLCSPTSALPLTVTVTPASPAPRPCSSRALPTSLRCRGSRAISSTCPARRSWVSEIIHVHPLEGEYRHLVG